MNKVEQRKLAIDCAKRLREKYGKKVIEPYIWGIASYETHKRLRREDGKWYKWKLAGCYIGHEICDLHVDILNILKGKEESVHI